MLFFIFALAAHIYAQYSTVQDTVQYPLYTRREGRTAYRTIFDYGYRGETEIGADAWRDAMHIASGHMMRAQVAARCAYGMWYFRDFGQNMC